VRKPSADCIKYRTRRLRRTVLRATPVSSAGNSRCASATHGSSHAWHSTKRKPPARGRGQVYREASRLGDAGIKNDPFPAARAGTLAAHRRIPCDRYRFAGAMRPPRFPGTRHAEDACHILDPVPYRGPHRAGKITHWLRITPSVYAYPTRQAAIVARVGIVAATPVKFVSIVIYRAC
jgi:hypothetical protein